MSAEPPGPGDEATTVARPRFEQSPLPESTFVLTIIEGPDAGRSQVLDGSQPPSVLIGQSPSCEVRLSDRQVSRRHASAEIVGSRLRLVDLGSKNGTFVNGLSVIEAFLRGGEIVHVGATSLRVDRRPSVTKPQISERTRFGRLIGGSVEMRRLYVLCERLAASNVPVIIEGETGTGKEALAESLHEMSPRAHAPFIVFDCTAVPPSLVESELFGHARGAFTGAVAARKGIFEHADTGTLLLDEIGDLEPVLQAKLLRAVERSEFRPVGASQPVKVDVRLLAATRRDLDREVQAGRFRDDLFHRLAVARIELPALRRRRGDIPVLVDHFCRELGTDLSSIPNDVLLRWQDYPWPGNVRELRNAVARHLALGDLIGEAGAPGDGSSPHGTVADPIERVLDQRLPFPEARRRVLEEFEARFVARLLQQHGGSTTKAAAASGIGKRYFQLIRARLTK